MSDRKKQRIKEKAAEKKRARQKAKVERAKDLAKKRAVRLKKEIRASIVKQVIKPTFDKGAWQTGAIPTTTEQPCNKPKGTGSVRKVAGVLKKGGFDKSSWLPPAQQTAPPVTPAPEKPVGFNKAAWKPKDEPKDPQE